MHNAAGGTIQRLKPGPATVWLRSRNGSKAIVKSSLVPQSLFPQTSYEDLLGGLLRLRIAVSNGPARRGIVQKSPIA
jgi:hypothetical protein